MSRKNLPSYRLHKASGQAVVTLNGKDFYLGKYKSKASREEYERIIADYLANGKKLPPTRGSGFGISIEELAIRFLEYAESYYQKNGRQTYTFNHCKLALSPLVRHYGNRPVSEFGPLSLVFVRDKWIEGGTARLTINRWVDIIRQAFRWGVAHELIVPDILHALEAVDGLRAGRTTAPEYEVIKPVPVEIVEKTLPFLPPILADMVRVQLHAGLRPQDVRNLRSCDIDRTGDVWVYRPFTHKNEHHGKTLMKAIGPRAQAILMPYLIDKQDSSDSFLFSPADSESARKLDLRSNRKTPVQPSQQKRNADRKANPTRKYNDQYSKDTYSKAIRRACEKAGVEAWSPNQLRHNAGTEARNKFGLEYAQAFLGHSNAKTTEIYAELSFEKAATVAREIG